LYARCAGRDAGMVCVLRCMGHNGSVWSKGEADIACSPEKRTLAAVGWSKRALSASRSHRHRTGCGHAS
jgi:hypothetical protein